MQRKIWTGRGLVSARPRRPLLETPDESPRACSGPSTRSSSAKRVTASFRLAGADNSPPSVCPRARAKWLKRQSGRGARGGTGNAEGAASAPRQPRGRCRRPSQALSGTRCQTFDSVANGLGGRLSRDGLYTPDAWKQLQKDLVELEPQLKRVDFKVANPDTFLRKTGS